VLMIIVCYRDDSGSLVYFLYREMTDVEGRRQNTSSAPPHRDELMARDDQLEASQVTGYDSNSSGSSSRSKLRVCAGCQRAIRERH